jgi:hypothetical protein
VLGYTRQRASVFTERSLPLRQRPLLPETVHLDAVDTPIANAMAG